MSIAKRINEVTCHLSKDCRLVAVSKFQPIPLLQEAYNCGQRIFGESKVQELVEKELKSRELTSYLRKTADNIASKTKSPTL